MTAFLANALKRHYKKTSNKIIFGNNSSLNQMALQMWELLDYSEIDHSVLSKVINEQRLFTFKQLSVFCKIMKLTQTQRGVLFDALINDKMVNEGISNKNDKLLYIAKLNHKTNTSKTKIKKSILLLDSNSRNLLKKILSEIIPKTYALSKIGIKFTDKSYYFLVDKGIQKYKPIIENSFANFDISIPYCNFKKTVKGLENNCKCGYHLALYGVIKECVSNGIYSKNKIQAEINKWVSFFFPKESVIYYLENSSSRSKDTNILLQNLKQNLGI